MNIDYAKLQHDLKTAIGKDAAEKDWKNRTNFFRNMINDLWPDEYLQTDVVKYSVRRQNDYNFGYTIYNYMLENNDIWLMCYIDTKEVRIFRIKCGTCSIDDFKINNDNDFRNNPSAKDEPDKRGFKIPSREKNGKLIEIFLGKVDFKPLLWKTIDFEHKKVIDNPSYEENKPVSTDIKPETDNSLVKFGQKAEENEYIHNPDEMNIINIAVNESGEDKTYDYLFTYCLRDAENIEYYDRYIHKGYQINNLKEFIETIAKARQGKETNFYLETTEADDKNYQINLLDQLKMGAKNRNIIFTYHFVKADKNENHPRDIYTGKWNIGLDIGLDFYQKYKIEKMYTTPQKERKCIETRIVYKRSEMLKHFEK